MGPSLLSPTGGFVVFGAFTGTAAEDQCLNGSALSSDFSHSNSSGWLVASCSHTSGHNARSYIPLKANTKLPPQRKENVICFQQHSQVWFPCLVAGFKKLPQGLVNSFVSLNSLSISFGMQPLGIASSKSFLSCLPVERILNHHKWPCFVSANIPCLKVCVGWHDEVTALCIPTTFSLILMPLLFNCFS